MIISHSYPWLLKFSAKDKHSQNRWKMLNCNTPDVILLGTYQQLGQHFISFLFLLLKDYKTKNHRQN